MNRHVIVRNKGVFEEIDKAKQLYCDYVDHVLENLSDNEIVRDICSKQEIEDLLERIEFTRTIQGPSLKIVEEFYEEAMSKYEEIEWIKVIKSEYMRRKMHKTFPFEQKMSDLAKKYVYSEISILMNIPYNEVEQYIAEYIRQNDWDEDL